MSQDIDLWGDPVPAAAEKRGRPIHEVTDKKRVRVAVLRALNQTNAEIAAAIGITEPTLRKYYAVELRHGFAQKRAELFIRLWDAVEAGNVSAMRTFLAQTEKSDLVQPSIRRPARSPKLGKKEQAAIDAATPDTGSSMGELMARRMSGEVVH